jgi:YHS domain-containing protein
MKNPITKLIRSALAGAAVLTMLLTVGAPDAFAKSQEICPVMGGKIDKSVYADHDGKRVYFCCPGCIATFEAEPAKFIAKAEKDGVELDKTPAAEPSKPKSDKGHSGHGHATPEAHGH